MKNSKLKSTKLWITIYCLQLLGYIVIQGKTDFVNIANMLQFVPLAYLGVNVWQKNIFNKKEVEQK